jgi:hypothetical protein
MLMLAVTLLGIGAVPLAGGRLAALGEVRLRRAWLIPVALAIQVYITTIAPNGSRGVHVAAHLGSYVLAGAFVVANRDLPFSWLVALGGALNLLVITANGGVMPADADALQRAGWPSVSDQFENSIALAHPRLLFLGDVFAVPSWVPFANVFSIGDVLLVLGGIAVVHRLCGSRLTGSQLVRSREADDSVAAHSKHRARAEPSLPASFRPSDRADRSRSFRWSFLQMPNHRTGLHQADEAFDVTSEDSTRRDHLDMRWSCWRAWSFLRNPSSRFRAR